MKAHALLIGAVTSLLALVGVAVAQVPDFFAPNIYRHYVNEFDRYAEADWTLTTTEAGASSATEALTNVDGGALLITNDAADDDRDFYQLPSEGFKYEAGKRLYCGIRFRTSDATQSDITFGLQITDTTPLDVTDGIFFIKADGAATANFRVEKDDTATTTSSVATLANNTWTTWAFYYDGSSSDIKILVDGVVVGSSVLTNVPDDEELTISFGIQNGEAVAKTMTVDYVGCYKQRS